MPHAIPAGNKQLLKDILIRKCGLAVAPSFPAPANKVQSGSDSVASPDDGIKPSLGEDFLSRSFVQSLPFPQKGDIENPHT